jgi:uncharacterized lipoprotein YajG
MKRLAAVVMFVTVLSSGCAFAPHKSVVINPELSVKESAMGQGQKIWTNVVDERPRSTLGTRVVRGVVSEISVEGDLRVAIRNSVADGLRRQGFSPVDTRLSDDRELRVEIRNLDYTVFRGFWAGTLRTECGLKAVCLLGSSRPYENLYRGEFQESIQVIQPEEANERYINSAVSSAINALLLDPQLMRCLASPKQP